MAYSGQIHLRHIYKYCAILLVYIGYRLVRLQYMKYSKPSKSMCDKRHEDNRGEGELSSRAGGSPVLRLLHQLEPQVLYVQDGNGKTMYQTLSFE